MNTKEYIESGILEQYVMGTLSAQEKQEVECMSHIYPEIEAELVSVQSVMEAFANSISKTPPADLRDKILGNLQQLALEEIKTNVLEKSQKSNFESSEIKQLKSSNDSHLFRVSFNAMRIAASLLFLTGLGLAYLLYNSNSIQKKQADSIANLQKELQLKSHFLDEQKSQLAILQDPDFQKIDLAGIPTKSADSKAIIYWNKKSKDVFLRIQKLPQIPEDKQYQLWAIADGKPVDMGMLNGNNMDSLFQKMKSIAQAQAFAITLEKKGGVSSPTLSEMYVMGGV